MSNKSDNTQNLIFHYQKKLDKYHLTGEHEKLIYCIHKLKYLPVTVIHLEETGVGKSINSLRHIQGQVGEKAKALVQKWKQMVSAEEQEDQPELRRPNELQEEYEREPSLHEECDDGEDSEENNCLHIEEKNYNPTGTDCKIEEENFNGYNPKTSREDYLSVGINSDHSSTYNPIVKLSSESDKQGNDSCYIVPNSSDLHKVEKDNLDEKHAKRKHKSKSHYSSNSHKNKKERERSPSKSDHESKNKKDKSKDKNRHKHKYRSTVSDQEKNHISANHSMHDKTREVSVTNFNRHNPSNSHQTFENEPSSSKKLLSGNKEFVLQSINKPFLPIVNNNNDNSKYSKEVVKSCSSSSSSSKRSSKSVEKSKRRRDTELVSSGFEAALMDMDLPSKKKKKKKSKDKDESDSEKKETSKSNAINQPRNLNLDHVKSIPVLPTFDDELDEPISSQLMTHYKPLPQVPQRSSISSDPYHSKMTEEEALNYMLSSRNNSKNRKIYTGKTAGLSFVPSLYDSCLKVLQDNIDALETTGGVPYDILKPVLERATPLQLFVLEDFNPYLLDDSDELWASHCRKSFKNKMKEEMENWRDMYIRCTDEQHHKMRMVTESLQKKYITKAVPKRTTQLAFVNVAAKPPKNVARAQAKYGTGSSSSQHKPSVSRTDDGGFQSLQRNAVINPRLDRPIPQYKPPASKKPKVAPLMAKTRQLMKQVCRR